MNEIRFTTTDKDVYEAFSTLSIDGVEIAGEVILDDASQDWPTLLIQFSSGTAVGLFSNWLYGLLKSKIGSKSRINGEPAPNSPQEINIFISNSTNINVQVNQNNHQPEFNDGKP